MRMSMLLQLLALAVLPRFALSEGGGSGAPGKDVKDLADRAIDKAKGKDVKGRKDAGQEGVPDEKKLKEILPGIAKVMKATQDQNAVLSAKVKAGAKASGFMSVVVRAAAKAFLAEPETREKESRQAEQMEMAFEVVEKLKK